MACVILCSTIVIIKEKRKQNEFYRMSFCSTDVALKRSLSFISAFTLVHSTVSVYTGCSISSSSSRSSSKFTVRFGAE